MTTTVGIVVESIEDAVDVVVSFGADLSVEDPEHAATIRVDIARIAPTCIRCARAMPKLYDH